jgi:inosose dehydratase
MISGNPIKFGASPLNWWFGLPIHQNLIPSGDDILREMAETGYDGTELGGSMPSDPATLSPLLEKHDVELAGGWFGAELLSQPFDEQKKKFTDFMLDLKRMGSKTVVIAEVTHVPIGVPYADDVFRDVLTENLFPYALPFLRDHEWKTLADGLEEFYNLAQQHDMQLAYHPHMQMLVQDQWQIERLIEEAPFLTFCMDTGHLYFAGIDPAKIIAKHIDKTVHIHFKNVRPDIIARARREPMPWMWSKIEGAFTVPGDGGIDFVPILETIKQNDWKGWIVVEAEQNPLVANPYLYAGLAREYLKDVTGI